MVLSLLATFCFGHDGFYVNMDNPNKFRAKIKAWEHPSKRFTLVIIEIKLRTMNAMKLDKPLLARLIILIPLPLVEIYT
jgi:hypothetical protein